MLYVSVYVEINILALIVLLFICGKARGNFGSPAEVGLFRAVLLATVLGVMTDIAWVLGEHGLIPFSRTANGLVNALYQFMTGAIAFAWMIFCEVRMGKARKSSPFHRAVIALPLVALLALCALSVKGNFIFYIDEQNVYHRGPVNCVQWLVGYMYLFVATFRCLFFAFREKNRAQRAENFTLASFAVLPSVGTVVQLFVYGLPGTYTLVAVSLLMIFVDLQGEQIVLDALTGLNNRRRADEYLYECVSGARREERLWFIMGDIDAFKQVNDRYGHVEGDRALRAVAAALKQVCNRENVFLARIGGDEFCMIYTGAEDFDAEALLRKVDSQIACQCEREGLPYPLTMCFGYAERCEKDRSPQALIERADKMLYARKAALSARERAIEI